MTTLQQFRCEVWGLVTTNPIHWFVIRCGDSNLTVYRWISDRVNAPGARHDCGEADAEVYISRWFDSVCAPPKPSFTYRLDGASLLECGIGFRYVHRVSGLWPALFGMRKSPATNPWPYGSMAARDYGFRSDFP